MITENKQIIFTDDLQTASDHVITDIIKDPSKKSLIISSYPDIEHRWRNALSIAHVLPDVSVVKGASKEKARAIHSCSGILFLPPGSLSRLRDDDVNRFDLLVIDKLHDLISTGRDKKRTILSLSESIPQTIGISYSLNGNHLRTLWDELSIIGEEQRIGISKSSYYERYYFSERISHDSSFNYIRELKPGALKAVRKHLKKLAVEIKKNSPDVKSRYFIPLDYHERSIDRFIHNILEDTPNER
jgi:hypothetical protein